MEPGIYRRDESNENVLIVVLGVAGRYFEGFIYHYDGYRYGQYGDNWNKDFNIEVPYDTDRVDDIIEDLKEKVSKKSITKKRKAAIETIIKKYNRPIDFRIVNGIMVYQDYIIRINKISYLSSSDNRVVLTLDGHKEEINLPNKVVKAMKEEMLKSNTF